MSKTPAKISDNDAIIEELKRELQDYKNIIENDRKVIGELKDNNNKLQNEIDILKNNNNEIKKDFEKLKKEFDEYKVRHPANIGIKNGKLYEYKAEIKKESTDKSKKKPGAVKGHRGYHRIAPDHIDKHVNVTMEQCPDCWNKLDKIVETRKRLIENIPVIKPEIIEYDINRYYCNNCKRIVEPSIDAALPGAQLSLRTMLVIAFMKTVERLPVRRVSEIMENIFSIKVTIGEIMHILKQLSKYLGKDYKKLVKRIRKAKSRYTDETSWRINGKNTYMWAFVTEGETLYVTGTRSHNVPEKVLKEHNGVDMHDGYSGYIKLAKITKNEQAWCWAHIIKDAKELIQYNREEGEYIYNTLKYVYSKAKKMLDIKPEDITESDLESLYDDFLQIDVPYESKKCRGFVNNQLRRRRDDLFRFVINRSVESTNNRAERAIRPIVTYRKVSGGSRSQKGADYFTRVYSVLESYRKKGKLKGLLNSG